MVQRYYEDAQAYGEPLDTPKRYDAESSAYVDTTGKAYDPEAEAWAEKWSRGIEIDIYSAANDTVYYYVNGNRVDLCTTDSNGKGSAMIPTGIPITLYSTIADDPDNMMQKYSKTVKLNVTDTTLYFMPDGEVRYWYGYVNPAYGYFTWDFGMFSSGYTGSTSETRNANSISWSNNRIAMVSYMGNNKLFSNIKVKSICSTIGTGYGQGLSSRYGNLGVSPQDGKSVIRLDSTNKYYNQNDNISRRCATDEFSNMSGYAYLNFGNDGVNSHSTEIYAFWVESL